MAAATAPVVGYDLLSTKEQLLTAYLDFIPAEAYIKDLNGNYIYVNRQFETTHGVTCDEITRTPHQDANFYGPEQSQELMVEDQKILAKERTVLPSHCTRVGIDGSTSNMVSMKFPLRNAQGETIAIGGLIHDNLEPPNTSTEVVKTSAQHEKAPLPQPNPIKRPRTSSTVHLNEEEESADWERLLIEPGRNYQRLFTKMQLGAALSEVVSDENGNPTDFVFRELNPAFEKLTGLKASETVGLHATEAMPGIEKDPADWIGKLGQVALTGKTFEFDEQYCQCLKKWYGGIAYRPSGQTGLFVLLFLDVSDSVEAQQALRESEEQHRNLFESMMQGVVYQESSGNIIAANPSAERILGLTIDQMMGRTSVDPRWKSIREDGSDFPGDQHPAMMALKTGKPVTGVLMGVFHPTTEKHHWIIIDAIPRFRPGESEPYQVYATFTDMTQTKEFERRILREKERAEMADRLKSAFLANMSHEIRTPLNGIIGNIDLALSNGLSGEQKEENLAGLQVARQSGELLISIIQDILDLSKIEAGEMAIENNGHFQLRKLVDQVNNLCQTMISQRGKAISFESHVQAGIEEQLCGDVYRLHQVLNNLVSNAVKFTSTGWVKLKISLKDESMVLFEVSDTGKGIAKDHMESIFEPFRQVDIGDTRKHGGTGLGLTISRRLVEMMGGNLSVESSMEKPNNGSSFCVSFPYRKYVPPEGKESTAATTTTSTNVRSKGTVIDGKVLVAEDEHVSRRLVKRMLEISGYEVLLAEDGLQAVEKYKTNDDIALILMDVQMPNMDGLQATTLIREWEANTPDKKPVPIIALSAATMKGDDERGLAVGMTRYLTKPVNFKLLQDALRTYLGERVPLTNASR